VGGFVSLLCGLYTQIENITGCMGVDLRVLGRGVPGEMELAVNGMAKGVFGAKRGMERDEVRGDWRN
jgi:hypothetical protein